MSCSIYHYGVKGMKWGQRRQAKRQAVMREASERAAKLSRGHNSNIDYYKNMKLNKATESDRKRWINSSKNAEKYFTNKQKEFSKKSTSSISKKDVKNAKKWMKNYTSVHDAEYTDYYENGRWKNYLNDLSEMDRRRG